MSALKHSSRTTTVRVTFEPAAPVSREDALADAVARIITGRPLAEHLRPKPMPTLKPETVEQGLGWILAGPGSDLVH